MSFGLLSCSLLLSSSPEKSAPSLRLIPLLSEGCQAGKRIAICLPKTYVICQGEGLVLCAGAALELPRIAELDPSLKKAVYNLGGRQAVARQLDFDCKL